MLGAVCEAQADIAKGPAEGPSLSTCGSEALGETLVHTDWFTV